MVVWLTMGSRKRITGENEKSRRGKKTELNVVCRSRRGKQQQVPRRKRERERGREMEGQLLLREKFPSSAAREEEGGGGGPL